MTSGTKVLVISKTKILLKVKVVANMKVLKSNIEHEVRCEEIVWPKTHTHQCECPRCWVTSYSTRTISLPEWGDQFIKIEVS